MINGIRPSPLKINKDSHVIQKQAPAPKQQQRQGPVIIYTHSPKIIHTQARDFMALVQKLTGFSRSDEVNETAPSRSRKNSNKPKDDSFITLAAGNRQEDNDSSSALTDENGSFGRSDGFGHVNNNNNNNVSSSSVPTNTISAQNAFFADLPLFTPNSSDFFCSPRPVYKFADNTIMSPSLGNLNSPSLLEFMKGLPDY